MRCGGLGVGLARPTDHRNRTRGTSASPEHGGLLHYSLLQPFLLEIIDSIDYHRAVESGAVGHSSVTSLIHLNVLLYTAPP
jgi:hypothetical protein